MGGITNSPTVGCTSTAAEEFTVKTDNSLVLLLAVPKPFQITWEYSSVSATSGFSVLGSGLAQNFLYTLPHPGDYWIRAKNSSYCGYSHTLYVNVIGANCGGSTNSLVANDHPNQLIATPSHSYLSASVLLDVNIYPNPTSGWVTVRLGAEEPDAVSVVATDILGQRVAETKIDAGSVEATMNISQSPAGVYLIAVRRVDGSVAVRKIIKE